MSSRRVSRPPRRHSGAAGRHPVGVDGGGYRAADARTFTQAISAANTIVWNGPLGVCEIEAFAKGTRAVARAVASARATTIVGGGDTVAAVNQAGVAERSPTCRRAAGRFWSCWKGVSCRGLRPSWTNRPPRRTGSPTSECPATARVPVSHSGNEEDPNPRWMRRRCGGLPR